MRQFNRGKKFGGSKFGPGKEKRFGRDDNQSGRGRFSDRSGARSERRDFGGSRGPPEMHTVTCDKCGQECEVPFKPTNNKPVYCRDCFRKNDRSSERSESSGSSGELDQINKKLDKIMRALKVQ